MTSVLPKKYADPEYEQAHQSLFVRPARHIIKRVLPPGVREADFDQAVQEFVSAVGQANVIVDQGLSDYIDPYDIWEADEGKRKTPSAAVL